MPAFIDSSVRLLPVDLLSKGFNASKFKAAFTRRFLPRSLEYGTTLFEVKSGGSLSFQNDLKYLRLLSRIKKNYALDFISTWTTQGSFAIEGTDELEHESAVEEYLRKLAKYKLVGYVEVECGRENYRHAEFMLRTMQRLGMEYQLRAIGGDEEILLDLAKRFQPAAIYELNNMRQDLSGEMAVLPGVFVFSPGRDFLANREDTSAARQLMEHGAAIALASGYHPEKNPSQTMQMVLMLAVLRMGLTIEEAVSAATINAAYAVGQEMSLGSLEKDKWADFLVLDLPDYREISRQYGMNHVSMVFRRGARVFDRRRSAERSVSH